MNEQQWLSSENPREMRELLQAKGLETDAKLRAWVEACRARSGVDAKASSWPDLNIRTELFESASTWANTLNDGGAVTLSYRCHLVREIWGNPFRPVVKRHAPKTQDATYKQWLESFNSSLLFEEEWLTPTVLSIATIISRDGKFDDMPILGDALEDTGCTNEDVLRHARGEERCPVCEGTGAKWKSLGPDLSPCTYCSRERDGQIVRGWIPARGPHVAGCWLLSLIIPEQ